MSYKEHVESVIESLRNYVNGEDTDLILLYNHLNQLVDDISIELESK